MIFHTDPSFPHLQLFTIGMEGAVTTLGTSTLSLFTMRFSALLLPSKEKKHNKL